VARRANGDGGANCDIDPVLVNAQSRRAGRMRSVIP
jgi:hypothetical protein